MRESLVKQLFDATEDFLLGSPLFKEADAQEVAAVLGELAYQHMYVAAYDEEVPDLGHLSFSMKDGVMVVRPDKGD
jgi:hypothetical protein